MQNSELAKRDRRAPLLWFFSATSARLRTRLGGTIFSGKPRAPERASEPLPREHAQAGVSGNAQAPEFTAEPTGAPQPEDERMLGADAANVRGRVVLFAPGPVSEAEFYRDSRKMAATVKRRRRRHRSTRWVAENTGTALVVAMLLVLAWIISAR
jgi:hypothetical protein